MEVKSKVAGDGEVRWNQGGLILGLQGRLLDPKEFQLE